MEEGSILFLQKGLDYNILPAFILYEDQIALPNHVPV